MISKVPKGKRPDKNENYILFKADSNAKKQWLPLSAIQSFTIDDMEHPPKLDTFVVSKSVYAARLGYIEVELDTKIKIYSAVRYQAGAPMMMSGGMTAPTGGEDTFYLFGSNPDDLTEITKKNFIESITQIMAKKPWIVKAVQQKDLPFRRIYEVIEYYKTGHKPEPEY